MRIYLAGHGEYGASLYNTLKFFKDNLDNVDYMTFDNMYEDRMENYLKSYHKEPIIVVTDFLGGSVNACAMKLSKKYKFFLCTGVNVGFLLEILFSEPTAEEEIREILVESKKQTIFVNDLFGEGNND